MWTFLRRQKYNFCLLLVISVFIWAFSSFKTTFQDLHVKSQQVVKAKKDPTKSQPNRLQDYQPLPCRINDQVLRNLEAKGEKVDIIPCLKKNIPGSEKDLNTVFVPFTFVQNYFEVIGELKQKSNSSFLSWSHSYSKVYPRLLDTTYRFSHPYLQFAEFDVENRQRVKCVTASEGVPISTQWDKNGYYYSTQISQFGLAHYSKFVSVGEANQTRVVFEDGGSKYGDWKGPITRVLRDKCVHFDNASPVSLTLRTSATSGSILSFALQFKEDTVVSVSVRSKNSYSFTIKYVPEDDYIRRDGNVIMLGYGSELKEGEWKHFTRDLMKDIQKGLGKKAFLNYKRRAQGIAIDDLTLEGVGCITNVSLANQEYFQLFLKSADWLVKHQDSNGGWANDVVFNKDKTKYPFADEIEPGWYSAMAQGHALSVLSRAYSATSDERYLDSGFKALDLFQKDTQNGGFVAEFMNTFVWYEEYPTNPHTFVLNGFMYSLLGLYDFTDMLTTHDLTRLEKFDVVQNLLKTGMTSLKSMLPLYDTGSGTVYDLRHFTMKTEPKIARWDYHSTHINQLFVLSTIDKDPVLIETAQRWRNYMLGKRAKHN